MSPFLLFTNLHVFLDLIRRWGYRVDPVWIESLVYNPHEALMLEVRERLPIVPSRGSSVNAYDAVIHSLPDFNPRLRTHTPQPPDFQIGVLAILIRRGADLRN
jgi:hypothetical protein